MNGEKIDDRDIRKHKNDVIRLFQLLSPESRIKLPIPIQNDFRIFLADIKDGPLIDCKSLGLRNTTQQKITEILTEIYEILAKPLEHDSSLQKSINLESSQPSLGSIIAESKGNEAAELIEKALASGADVNDQSRNGHRPLQLLIRAQIDHRLKIKLIEQLIERGADVNFADNSGLTPFQTAVTAGNKEIVDLLLLNGARKLVPSGIGYAQYYNMYLQLPP